ncbi:MAG: hypothetical protein Q7K65_01975 [Candidatus Buchananbacteria bacterium]|nr:hypothetical protein [Candidatus Buchananbacteria bacterium]
MRYHLYFHDDLDGMASGAVMLNFLKSRGDKIVSFNPINYAPGLKEGWLKHKFKEPFIMVDFLFHPNAAWWFDHHETSFLNNKLKDDFVNDATHHFNSTHKSVCGMVMAHLKKEFGYKPPKHIQYLAKWTDIIDSALYKSPKQVVEKKEPALKFSLIQDFLDKTSKGVYRAKVGALIRQLAEKPITEIIKLSQFKNAIAKQAAELKKDRKNFKNISKVEGIVVFVDSTIDSIRVPHFLSYFIYPGVSYSAVVSYHGGYYHLSIGKNRWAKRLGTANIGAILSKYGGGGHQGIGGLERKSKDEIMKISEIIIKYLNKHG